MSQQSSGPNVFFERQQGGDPKSYELGRETPAAGTAATMVNEQGDAQYRETIERQALPTGSPAAPQPIAVPEIRHTEGVEQTSLTQFLGNEPGAPIAPVQEGYGPRIVVLHAFVAGPGGAFDRGNVIWASQLLGHWASPDPKANIYVNQAAAVEAFRRYVQGPNPAVREANKAEAGYTQVTFIEGEKALAANLQNAKSEIAKVEDERSRLQGIITQLGADPNASPEEIYAALRNRFAQSEGLTPATSQQSQDVLASAPAGGGIQQPAVKAAAPVVPPLSPAVVQPSTPSPVQQPTQQQGTPGDPLAEWGKVD